MRIGLKLLGLICLSLLVILVHGRSVNQAETENDINMKEREPFNLEDIISNLYSGDIFNGSWISDTEIFFWISEHLFKFNVLTKHSYLIAKSDVFDFRLRFTLSPDRNYVLVRNTTASVYRHSSLSTYRIYNIKQNTTSIVAQGRPLSIAQWAPTGSSLVYVLDNDIYYHQIISDDSVEVRRVTFDGKPGVIYNGVPDWVYEEEVLGSDTAFWFSPNGEHLAFATYNDTEVHEAVIMRYGRPGTLESQYPQEVTIKYPKSGTTNPTVSLNLIDLSDHGSTVVSLKAPVEHVGNDNILYTVNWFDNKTVVATWTNRVQNVSEVVSYTLSGMYSSLLGTEVKDGWVLNPNAAPIRHGSHVLVLKPQPIENETLGDFPHVTRYRLLNGMLDHELDLTPGEMWVHEIHGINDVKRVVYFTAAPPNKPSQKHLYEVGLDTPRETKPTPKCLSCLVKTPEGNNCSYASSVSFSTDFSHYALTCGGPDPSFIVIYDLEGRENFVWNINMELRENLKKKVLPKQMDEIVHANGFDSRVRLLLPPKFDPKKKYPLLVNVYGGPETQRITDSFSVGFESYITTDREVIHAWIDGRGSSSKGTKMMYAVYRDLGNAEVEDQITVTRKLQQKYSWIDKNRTGVWGWSYGGYSTAMILSKDLEYEVFKCGISVAPVTNWLYYDSIYTERYMALPSKADNLKNYDHSSVLSRAMMLGHKKFMLIHGTGDDNVHYQQSMALSRALAEADVLYQQITYPDEAHQLNHVSRHLYHSMDKFWSECFNYTI